VFESKQEKTAFLKVIKELTSYCVRYEHSTKGMIAAYDVVKKEGQTGGEGEFKILQKGAKKETFN
jgi:hypothetical protein